MSESAEELATAVRGLGDGLTEAGSRAARLAEHTTELSEEAGAHGWRGVAGRMQEAAEALESSVGSLGKSQQLCVEAATELALIGDEIPAEEISAKLGGSSTKLITAVIEADEAIERLDEAQSAVAEVGQEGMMRATSELHDQLRELRDRIDEQLRSSQAEQVRADAFAGRPAGLAGPSPSSELSMTQEEREARRKFGGQGRPSIIGPSKAPDSEAIPRGHPETWSEKDDAPTVRGRRRENESAQIYAGHGYDIEQNPAFEGKNPDYLIEGVIFDNYSPEPGTPVRNIFGVVERKIESRQTRRVTVNLDDSDVTPDQLVEQFAAWPIPDLEQVTAVQGGKIYQVFPRDTARESHAD